MATNIPVIDDCIQKIQDNLGLQYDEAVCLMVGATLERLHGIEQSDALDSVLARFVNSGQIHKRRNRDSNNRPVDEFIVWLCDPNDRYLLTMTIITVSYSSDGDHDQENSKYGKTSYSCDTSSDYYDTLPKPNGHYGPTVKDVGEIPFPVKKYLCNKVINGTFRVIDWPLERDRIELAHQKRESRYTQDWNEDEE
jgi:hypothetical protein